MMFHLALGLQGPAQLGAHQNAGRFFFLSDSGLRTARSSVNQDVTLLFFFRAYIYIYIYVYDMRLPQA